MRLLLNVTPIQTALACTILQKLPGAQEEVQGSQETDSMPRLILGSLRWWALLPGTKHCLYCAVKEILMWADMTLRHAASHIYYHK